jgi:hypothetical protein
MIVSDKDAKHLQNLHKLPGKNRKRRGAWVSAQSMPNLHSIGNTRLNAEQWEIAV